MMSWPHENEYCAPPPAPRRARGKGKSSSDPECPQTQRFLEGMYAPMALKVADGVYDTALLLVLEVYKSQLLLNYDHRIIDCFGLEGILKI